MQITLNSQQVEQILRAHIAASLPGVNIYPGSADIQPGHREWDEPYFAGYSFSFEAKKTKYQELVEFIASLGRGNLVSAVKAVRTKTQNLSQEDLVFFPRSLPMPGGNTMVLSADMTHGLGLGYAKYLVLKVWEDEIPF